MIHQLEELRHKIESVHGDLSALHHGIISYSWEGEDVLARKILSDRFGVKKGFYVDVGAHHPIIWSNTHLLYQHGWRGINIDAMPGSMAQFMHLRPEDVNLETGIAGTASPRRFFSFEDPGLNGFLSEYDVSMQLGRGCRLLGESLVECLPLTAVLDQHQVPHNFDLLTIDVEGLEIEVLDSLDFTRYRPKLIIAEVMGCHSAEDAIQTPIAIAMKQRGYPLLSRLDFSVIFYDRATSI